MPEMVRQQRVFGQQEAENKPSVPGLAVSSQFALFRLTFWSSVKFIE